MKMKSPVVISMLEFIRDGKFDYIKIGQTREWIFHNFPSPDGWEEELLHVLEIFNIWRYGNIEFHFEEDQLSSIFCDDFSTYDEDTDKIVNQWNAGKWIDLDLWIFDRVEKLNLSYVMEILNQNRISFSVFHSDLNVVIRILKSNVELVFEKKSHEELDSDTNLFQFVAFGLGRVSNVPN